MTQSSKQTCFKLGRNRKRKMSQVLLEFLCNFIKQFEYGCYAVAIIKSLIVNSPEHILYSPYHPIVRLIFSKPVTI